MKRCAAHLLIACAAILCSAAAHAVEPWAGEFSLDIITYKTVFERGDADFDTRVKQVRATWSEQLHPRAAFALIGGYSYLTQKENALTAGEQLDGYHVGLGADIALLRAGRFNFALLSEIVYQRVRESEADQKVEFDWTEVSFALAGRLDLGGQVGFVASVSAGRLTGEERDRGTVRRTLDIERERQSGARLALDVGVEPGGRVGVFAERGLRDSAGVYFSRRF